MERPYPPGWIVGILLLASYALFGCSGGGATPTRTPVSTWTATPPGQVAQNQTPDAGQIPTVDPALSAPATLAPTSTSTPAPATDTPVATNTPVATDTPAATDTPTITPTPSPSPTVAYAFQLEAAEKFPTESLAANVVRIYLYVYSPTELGLAGYSLKVVHNGTPLTVDEVSTAGLPDQTRNVPSPYTRFTNINVLFAEPQTGIWEVQLVDQKHSPVGPVAKFELTADERTRELYVRYKQK